MTVHQADQICMSAEAICVCVRVCVPVPVRVSVCWPARRQACRLAGACRAAGWQTQLAGWLAGRVVAQHSMAGRLASRPAGRLA